MNEVSLYFRQKKFFKNKTKNSVQTHKKNASSGYVCILISTLKA